MSYIVSGDHITTPVSIYDVQQCLGNNSPDLGTLCLRPNINMWSVSKPVYFAKVGQLTDADLKTGRVISGYSTSYGIKKRASAVWTDFIDTSTGVVKSEVWEYDKPVLDGVNVFRLTDFYNYWHQAVCAMTIQLDSKTTVVVPASQGGSGDILHYMLNFMYWLYEEGAISSQQLFGACASYHPSIILTCYYQGGAWQYVKSSNLTIGEIGASSAQSGAEINIDTADLAAAMVADGARYGYDCFINGRQWSACMALLSGNAVPGTTAEHTVAGRTIVRMEYAAGADRNTFQIVSGKYSYISAMSMTVVIKRDTVNTNWYYIDSIQVTATKENSTSMNFSVSAQLSCVIGTVGMSQVAADAQTINVSMGTVNFTGSGAQQQPLTFNTVTYKPTADADPSGSRFCTGTITLHDQGDRGDWEGSFSINVKTGTTFTTVVALS